MVILGHTEQLGEELDTYPPGSLHLEEIRSAADRAAALTRQLLAFSRGQPAQSRPIDLGQVVDGLDSLLRRLIGEQVELEIRREEEPSIVVADPSQLEQLVVNLAVNARDAMPDGGRLAIAVGRHRLTEWDPPLQLPAGDYVSLTVTDSGEGMSREELDRAFDPFYTTKEQGGGTGLGLATVHAVAEQNGGRARIESEPGRGTSVHVLFPRREGVAVLQEPAPCLPRQQGGGETILLVEDEDSIRELFEESLREVGYNVLTASDGEKALDRAERFGGRIDLLVTDVVMPRLSGPDLVQRLSATRPELRVVYMSGYSPKSDLGQARPDRTLVLQKPFSPKLLHARVRDLLDGPTTARSAGEGGV
jgi:CheY-like chemotaxis protein